MTTTNTIFVPPRFGAADMRVAPNIYVRDDRLYVIDKDGKVHYFKYIGVNLHFGIDE